MGNETSQLLVEATKLVVLPALGFVVGFASQWWLQTRKSRDELLRALADKRADALCKLWAITTLSLDVTDLAAHARVPVQLRRELDAAILQWYTAQSGALYLSWGATQTLFRFLDALRSDETQRIDLENVVSALRTQLKLDCGIYSPRQAKRQLMRPRSAPWSAKSTGAPAHGETGTRAD